MFQAGRAACSRAPRRVKGRRTPDKRTARARSRGANWSSLRSKARSTTHDRVSRQAQTASDGEKEPPSHSVGVITNVLRGKKWYSPPSFFLHAGDQIYYDFPDVDREPDRNEYRVAYREALFYDVANRHLLSHWPQYMTLDDHEIADQYAQDFNPPCELQPTNLLHGGECRVPRICSGPESSRKRCRPGSKRNRTLLVQLR